MMREKEGVWELPGGRAQKGENLIECLIRECREETSLHCEVLEQQPSIVFSAVDQNGRPRLMVFYAINFEHLDFTPSDECVEMRFFDKKEIRKLPTNPQVAMLVQFL